MMISPSDHDAERRATLWHDAPRRDGATRSVAPHCGTMLRIVMNCRPSLILATSVHSQHLGHAQAAAQQFKRLVSHRGRGLGHKTAELVAHLQFRNHLLESLLHPFLKGIR